MIKFLRVGVKETSEVVQDRALEMAGNRGVESHTVMIKVWSQETIAGEVESDLQDAIVSTTPKGTEAGIETIDIKTLIIGAEDLITSITVGENITPDPKKKTVYQRTFI